MNTKEFYIGRIRIPPAWLVVLCVTYLALIPDTLLAADIYVPSDYSTIQLAIDVANDGDVIRVSAGSYPENINFKGKDITLQSIDGSASTFIDPAGGTVVTIGPLGKISGFTIKNGKAYFGAGISVSGAGTLISQNIFEDNSTFVGGNGVAINANQASPLIEQNIFRNNSCDGQWYSGVVSFVNRSSPRIINNIFADNPCRAIVSAGTGFPEIINNTIVRNRTGIRTFVYPALVSRVYNNIIVENSDYGIDVLFGPVTSLDTWKHNLIHNNGSDYVGAPDQTGLNGNISADPRFIDSQTGNFHLAGGSPAMDAGLSAPGTNIDYEGDIRPIDGDGDGIAAVDIGADELVSGMALYIEGGTNQECGTYGGSNLPVNIRLYPPSLTLSSIQLYFDGELISDSLENIIYSALGNHTFDVEVTTSSGEVFQDSQSVEIVDTTPPEIIARFIDKKTGEQVSNIESRRMKRLVTSIDVTDICDESSTYNATIGIPAYDGDPLKIKPTKKKLLLEARTLELTVIAKDVANNMSESITPLMITE